MIGNGSMPPAPAPTDGLPGPTHDHDAQAAAPDPGPVAAPAGSAATSEGAVAFHRMLADFTHGTPGVAETLAVSSDGLLLASSRGRDRAEGEQLAAVASGLLSLASGAARAIDRGRVEQLVIEMTDGLLFVTALGDGSALAVVAERDGDLGLIGYEMTLLLNRAGAALHPALVAELKNLLTP